MTAVQLWQRVVSIVGAETVSGVSWCNHLNSISQKYRMIASGVLWFGWVIAWSSNGAKLNKEQTVRISQRRLRSKSATFDMRSRNHVREHHCSG